MYAGKKVAPVDDAPAEAPEVKAKKAAGGKAGGESHVSALYELLPSLLLLAHALLSAIHAVLLLR
jgi:hypothetical protein